MDRLPFDPVMFIIVTIVGIVVIAAWILYCTCGTKSIEEEPFYVMPKQNAILRLLGLSRFEQIRDHFNDLDDVSEAIRRAGLESSNLIFGIDYTKSNTTQGRRTFRGYSLHAVLDNCLNPYQEVISILGRTLEAFDEDGIIPCFGFGDSTTRDKSVFPISCATGYCHGFQQVLQAYSDITPKVQLSGPTSFAPLIYQAIEIVKATKAYHILVIVADGQVTAPRATADAIVAATAVPLSIIVVGVGDGPWDMMQEFDDGLPQRKFDNFQFVEFNKAVQGASNAEAAFALAALMEIPDQFIAIRKLGMLG